MVGPVELVLAAGPLSGPVLARVVAAVAAQAGLDLDRLNDATLAAEAVASGAGAVDGAGPLRAVVEPSAGRVRLTFGPLPPGSGERVYALSALPGVGSLLDGVADEVSVQSGEGGDLLTVVVGRPA